MALRSTPSNIITTGGGTITGNTNFPNGINVYSENIAINDNSIKYYKLARVRFISTTGNPNGTFERALFNIKLYHTGDNLKIGNIKGYFYNGATKRSIHVTSFLMVINNSGSTGFSAGDILYFPLDSGSDSNDFIVDIYIKVTNNAKLYENTESAAFENGALLTIKPDGSTLISSLPVAGTTTTIDSITYTYGSSVNSVITSDLNSQVATTTNAIPKFADTLGALVGSTKLSINASDQLVSTVAFGTAPFNISSTTKVENLNVSFLNGIADTGFLRTSFSNALENNIGITAKESGGIARTVIQLDSSNLVNIAHPNLQTYLRGTAIYIANATQLQAKDTGGTSRNLISMNASNVVQVGATTNTTNLNGEVTTTAGITSPNTKVTIEGGIAVRMLNKTGANSVKGSCVQISDTTDNGFRLALTGSMSAMGFVYENGIADGSLCWVVVTGIAEALVQDSTAITRGDILIPSDTTAGRVMPQAVPTTAQHFQEVGHPIESKTAGTNVLVKLTIHFN